MTSNAEGPIAAVAPIELTENDFIIPSSKAKEIAAKSETSALPVLLLSGIDEKSNQNVHFEVSLRENFLPRSANGEYFPPK